MEFRVLGAVEVTGPDGPQVLRGRKELSVLAYLLAYADRAVPAEELVTAVWGEDAPPSAGKSLQVRVSHLRHDLGGGGELIVREGAGAPLPSAPAATAARRFERLVAEAAEQPPGEALA